jgi:hypothetical protein
LRTSSKLVLAAPFSYISRAAASTIRARVARPRAVRRGPDDSALGGDAVRGT